MQLGDFLLALAFHRGGGTKAVLLVNTDGAGGFPEVLQSAVQSGIYTYDTPIVNLLQNLSVSKVQGHTLYATYVPDEMDLGMACMRQVARVVYADGADGAKQRSLSDETGPGAPTGYSPYNAWELQITQFVNKRVDAPWSTGTKWSDRSWLPWWIDQVGRQRLMAGALTIVRSFGGLPAAFNARPKATIDTLNASFGQGLTGVDYSPCATLSGKTRDQIFMMAALALVGGSWSTKGGKNPGRTTSLEAGHNIGAVMVNANNQLIAWGLNLSDLHGTLHGETAMVLSYLRRNNVSRLPDGCRIYATLKPCHMCAGFIATVAKDVTVIYGQNDPKITNSALDAARGDGVTQVSSAVTIGGSATFGTFDARGRTMTVTEVLAEMINSSGLAAVPFLYSANANKFFTTIRSKPKALADAVKKFDALPPALSQLSIRSGGPQPEKGLQTIPLLYGQLKPTTMSRNASGLDLATGSALIPLPAHPLVPVRQLHRGEVRAMGAGAIVQVTDQSRTLQGLDLAIGNTDLIRKMGRRAGPSLLTALLGSLAAIQHFLQRLKTFGVLDFR